MKASLVRLKMIEQFHLGIVIMNRLEILGASAELVVHLLADGIRPHAGSVVEKLLSWRSCKQHLPTENTSHLVVKVKSISAEPKKKNQNKH
jgi:hypothetical protein